MLLPQTPPSAATTSPQPMQLQASYLFLTSRPTPAVLRCHLMQRIPAVCYLPALGLGWGERDDARNAPWRCPVRNGDSDPLHQSPRPGSPPWGKPRTRVGPRGSTHLRERGPDPRGRRGGGGTRTAPGGTGPPAPAPLPPRPGSRGHTKAPPGFTSLLLFPSSPHILFFSPLPPAPSSRGTAGGSTSTQRPRGG